MSYENLWIIRLGPELYRGKVIALVTPEELTKLEDGTVLYSITGERVTKGVDVIDTDARGGYLAYGLAKFEPQV
jgi:hypothetical protein